MRTRHPHLQPLTVLSGALLVIGLVACGPAGSAGAGPRAPSGARSENAQVAPEIQAQSVMGAGPTTLAEAAGKVVIVDFWGTFCAPCRKSLPAYQRLADAHGGEVVVIGVAVDDPEDVETRDVVDFATELGVRFAIVWDKEHKTAKAYRPPGMPTSYLIDREGKIRHFHDGYESGEEEQIAAEVAAMLE